MTIWRGEGGGGDATTDSEINFITSLTNSIVADTALTTANAAASAASALAAATSESNAAASEIAAASSASAASASAISADASANSAANSYDSFDDRYLGSKTVAPTLDNDGNALLVGALYWNSVTTKLFVWSGTAWRDGFFTGLSSSLVTATAGQTVVTTPTYVIGTNTIQVYVNGLKVILGTDFTETSTTSITFSSGLTLGDEVEIVVVQSLTIGTAAASNVSYTPTGTIAAANVQDALSELSSEKVQSTVLAASGGSSLVGYLPSGTGAVASTVQAKLRESVSVKDFGAVGDGVTNDTAAFTAAGSSSSLVEVNVPAGAYVLTTSPAPTGNVTWVIHNGATFSGAGSLPTQRITKFGGYPSTWVNGVSSGAYEYLAANAAFNVQQGITGVGLFSTGRSSVQNGASSATASIQYSAFGYNDYTAGISGVWGFYATMLRKSGNNGPTHGMEVDICNLGTTVSIFPASMFPAGLTDCLWLATGGETATATSAGTASCAIGILRNDDNATPSASFDKGIVFHNQAIAGCNGATGTGVAIAMASGHQLIWFNNSNQPCGELVSTAKINTNGTRLDFSDFGLLVADRISGGALIQVASVPNSVNYLTFTGAVSGSHPNITANGAGTNLDIGLQTKGTGNINFLNSTVIGTAGTLVGYMTVKINSTQYKIPYYNL